MYTIPNQDPSLTAKVPKGWQQEFYVSLDLPFKRAIDPDGCRWYWMDGEWTLNVPYFRNSGARQDDDIAVVDHISGELACPVSENGTISIGKRKVPQSRWHH